MIPQDKIMHFIAGSWITTITFIVMHDYFTFYVELTNLTGLLLAILGGYLKERFDEYRYGGFDRIDWLATALGGLVTSIILTLLF